MKWQPETKTAMGGAVGYLVGLVFQLLQTYIHGFTAPPASAVSLIVATLSLVASYWAPHTPRPVTPAQAPKAVSVDPGAVQVPPERQVS